MRALGANQTALRFMGMDVPRIVLVTMLLSARLPASPAGWNCSASSKLRLRRARQLIELTDMPITDIAIACGFISPSYFSKSFKDQFSVLPSQLRCC